MTLIHYKCAVDRTMLGKMQSWAVASY